MSKPARFGALRRRFAHLEPLPRLTGLGVVAGLLTGVVMVLLHAALEGAAWLVRGEDSETYEWGGAEAHLLMPVVGGLLLGLALHRLPPASRRLGVMHVLERLARHQGRMSWRDAVYQFGGTVVGLTAGLSGGREGPGVHLGSAVSGLLGEACGQSERGRRTLIACGSAAAIAASFNTPLAGVVFAMEVVLMEYTLVGFVPVIASTVAATLVHRWVFGDYAVFSVPETELRSLLEVPYIIFAGVAVGAVGGAFIALVKLFARFHAWPFWLRATAAGALTGGAALVTPAVLGVGYDTVDEALLGGLATSALLIILLAKMVASAACVGVGLPVGVIGPTLVMGAMLGGLLGELGNALAPGEASVPGLYVMLGMAAMMAAVLQAPLAALVAVLELTANPGVTLPAMLIIVVATLTVSHVFRQRSVFLSLLAGLGIDYPSASAGGKSP